MTDNQSVVLKELRELQALVQDGTLEDIASLSLPLTLTLERRKREALETEVAHLSNLVRNLQQQLGKEREKRLQIQDWIKTNLGPNLEVVRSLIQSSGREKGLSDIGSSSPSVSRLSPNDIFDFLTTSSRKSEPSSPTPTSSSETISSLPPPKSELERLERVAYRDKQIVPLHEDDSSRKANNPSRLTFFLEYQNQALEKYGIEFPVLKDKASEFAAAGGQLVFAPRSPSDIEKDHFSIGVKASDQVSAVCTDGLYRSQIMYLTLIGLKRFFGDTSGVRLPHGALNGYDPCLQPDTTKKYRFVSRTEAESSFSQIFEKTFQIPRVARFGEEKFGVDFRLNLYESMLPSEKALVDRNRRTAREYFSLYYYRISPKMKGRAVFFVFGSALCTVLERLIESNQEPGASLKNVLVVALPFGLKALVEEPSRMKVFDTYKFYASLLYPASE